MKRISGVAVAPGSGDLRMNSTQVGWSSHWDGQCYAQVPGT
jgi:hypothetical protein